MEKVLCERAAAWGACGGQTRRRNAVEGLIQSTGGYRVADAAGLVHAAAAAALSGRLLVGSEPLGLARVGVSSGRFSGAGRRGTKFLGLCQGADGTRQKGEDFSCRLQFASMNVGGFAMKLQPESKKELLRIACGTAICTAYFLPFLSFPDAHHEVCRNRQSF